MNTLFEALNLQSISFDKDKILEFLEKSTFLGIPNAIWVGGLVLFLISRSEHKPYDN